MIYIFKTFNDGKTQTCVKVEETIGWEFGMLVPCVPAVPQLPDWSCRVHPVSPMNFSSFPGEGVWIKSQTFCHFIHTHFVFCNILMNTLNSLSIWLFRLSSFHWGVKRPKPGPFQRPCTVINPENPGQIGLKMEPLLIWPPGWNWIKKHF